MKKIMALTVSCVLASSMSFAQSPTTTTTTTTTTPTAMDANWICTTNASASTVDTEKAADDKMANTSASAADAFNFAAANCRDCTKITCQTQ